MKAVEWSHAVWWEGSNKWP